MRELVTVITPTFNRPELLLNRCIPSVLNQTYPNIEYYVGSDGDNPELELKIKEQYPQIKYFSLGRQWGWDNMPPPKGMTFGNWGSIQRLIASFLCKGRYIAFIDDDNEYLPEHIEKLVNLIEEKNVDFVYSKLQYRGNKKTLFQDPPIHAGIDTNVLLHKFETIKKCMWGWGQCADWYLVECWMKNGLTWASLDEITIIKD